MRKRIAFITANTDTLYQTSMINIMSEKTSELEYDFIVLTHFVNYDNGGDYLRGDENIYSLIDQLSFDGALVDLGSFFSCSLTEKLERMLYEKKVPVIALDCQSERLESCIQNDRAGFRKLTEHFIKVHGFTDIYCLSGPENEVHSEERINGFKDAFMQCGIPLREENIFYGDFWIGSAKNFAQRIVSGELAKPQAVLCGSDYMALQLCLSLIRSGISVPNEIAVGGYDGNPDVNSYQPSLTSYSSAYLDNAVRAVYRLHEKISGEKLLEAESISYLRFGASCGCTEKASENAEISQKMLDNTMRTNIFMHSNYSSAISNVRNLFEVSAALLANTYLLDENGDFFLCLCGDAAENDDISARSEINHGYTDKMRCIVSRTSSGGDLTPQEFSLESIIPEKYMQEKPVTYICTPLHYLDTNFGYCVRRYRTEKIVLEQFYGEFCQIAADGIERVRMLAHEKSLNDKISRLSERDILTGLLSRKGVISRMENRDNISPHFAVLYNINYTEQNMTSFGDEYIKQVYVAFSQAVNISCVRGEIAARIRKDEFLVIGRCDDSAFPEQLFINTLKSNIRMIEKQQDISLTKLISHFSAIYDDSAEPERFIAELESEAEKRRNYENSVGNPYITQIYELHDSICEEPQIEWKAGNEAERLGISQSYFQHIYRKLLDVSFNSDVIAARLSLAERLLADSNLTVGEISEKCGYSEQSYFMKLFKRKKGMTALEYRRKRHE